MLASKHGDNGYRVKMVLLYFFFSYARDGAQDLAGTRQVLYQWASLCPPFEGTCHPSYCDTVVSFSFIYPSTSSRRL
jgi:hypothetical protein